MAATSSTLPQVKDALLTALRTALPDTQVTRYHPGTQVQRNEVLYLADARATSTVPVSRAGRAKRQEEVRLDVVIEVVRPGSTPEAAEERAFAIMAELEDVLADDMTLGELPIIRAYLSDWESSTLATDDARGWNVQLVVTVTFEARLS